MNAMLLKWCVLRSLSCGYDTDSPPQIRWIRQFDLEMQCLNRLVVLLIDNFSGHHIPYKAKNIELVYFKPNITSHHAPSQRHAAGSLIGRILTGRPCVSRWQNSTVATGYVGPVDRQGPERVTAKGFGPGRADDAKGFPGAYCTSLAAGASRVTHSPCSCSYTMLLL
jgi:hypothetical protein